MRKTKKQITQISLVFSLIFNLIVPQFAAAYSFNVPSLSSGGTITMDLSDMVDEAASGVEDRYGFNSDVWTTAQRKVTAPRVEIDFDNSNPKAGEKVTAHAIPEYFKNEPKNLYYTWYVIHTTDGSPKNATNTIKEGKIEAAKIMAKGDYDYSTNCDTDTDEDDCKDDVYSDSDDDPDEDGWPTVDSNSFDADTSQAPMGGSDGAGGIEDDSDNFDPSLSEYCSDKTDASNCTLYTEKSAFDSYYQFNGTQSDEYCSTCASESLSFGTLTSDNQCCYLVQNPLDTTYSGYDIATTYCPSSYSSSYESCFDYTTLQSTNESAIEACLSDECTDDYNEVHGENNLDTGDSDNDYSRCFQHNFGVNKNALGFRGYSGSSGTYTDDKSGLDYNVSCKHKWVSATDYTSASGEFTTGEEEYWGTDPTDPDTDGDGYNDGADVIGLGQQDFTWTYQSGDRVGVVVEGTSMIPTDENNAYYKIMWGYIDVCNSTNTGLLENDNCEDSDDYGFGFLGTVAPNESGGDKISISLSYTPENPVADSTSDNTDNINDDGTIADADQITVSSALNNTDYSSNTLYYAWRIQKGVLGDDNSWENLTPGEDFQSATVLNGMGLSSLSFTPKTSAMQGDDDIVYFRVTLTASKASGVTSKRGRVGVIIPVNKKGIHLNFYSVNIDDGKATLGDEVCKGLTYCPVVKNQLFAAKVSSSNYTSSNSDFSWSINGEDYPTPSDPSDLFDGWSDTKIYFGIIEDAGETPDVSVTATPDDEQQAVTGTRYLYVASPSVYISSGDTDTSWGKESTVEDDNSKDTTYTVVSDTSFEAKVESEVSYSLQLSPSYLYTDPDNVEIDWKINGTSITSEDFSEEDLGISGVATENNDKTLKFTTGSDEDASYTIEADVKKYWSSDEKNILSTAWDIDAETLESSSSIDVTTVADTTEESETTSMKDTGQILAAIGTHLPHYFMYLLRLVITISVMFVMSSLFYGISQKVSLGNNEE